MNEVVRFFVFGIPLAALGLFIDRILLRRQKVELHQRLLRAWINIDAATFPDHARRISARVTEAFTVPSDRRHYPKLVGKLILLSWLFTSFAAAIGGFMDGERTMNPYHWLPIFPVYFVNVPFDAITVVLTYFTLQRIARSGPLMVLGLVILNAAVAALIAAISLPMLVWSHNVAHERNWPGSGNQIQNMAGQLVDLEQQVDKYFAEEVTVHFQSSPTIPFEKELTKWTGTDVRGNNFQFGKITYRVESKPGGMLERQFTVNPFPGPDASKTQLTATVEFSSNQRFSEFYTRNIHEIFTAFDTWKGRQRGTLSVRGPSGEMSAGDLEFSGGKWGFVFVAATTLIPTLLLGFSLGLLATLKLVRDSTAALTKYFIERTTEDDPSYSPEKFAPFTLLFSSVSLMLYLSRQLFLFVADLFA